MTPDSTLDAQVRRMRAGIVYAPSSDDSVSWWPVLASIVSMAAAEMDNQTDRLNRFSMPLLPTNGPDVRANAAGSAQRFLSQLRSDYRRVALPRVNLVDVERQRQSQEWSTELEKAGIHNCSVAILVVGQYLASDRSADLADALKPWIFAEDHPDDMSWFENAFGPVIGPVVHLALSAAPDEPKELPKWAGEVGEPWCSAFLKAGAHELRSDQRRVPALSYG
ncbi:MAG: hypothetical protein JWR37_6114 [Mycobacterium sp.]|nr:hypothetical protein [Mycobacterium sp.]